jgi:hypothetical protein
VKIRQAEVEADLRAAHDLFAEYADSLGIDLGATPPGGVAPKRPDQPDARAIEEPYQERKPFRFTIWRR